MAAQVAQGGGQRRLQADRAAARPARIRDDDGRRSVLLEVPDGAGPGRSVGRPRGPSRAGGGAERSKTGKASTPSPRACALGIPCALARRATARISVPRLTVSVQCLAMSVLHLTISVLLLTA